MRFIGTEGSCALRTVVILIPGLFLCPCLLNGLIMFIIQMKTLEICIGSHAFQKQQKAKGFIIIIVNAQI